MDETTLTHTLTEALQAHAAEDSARAEALCRQVLTAAPQRPEALTLLGILRRRGGQLDEAQQLYTQAIAAAPHYADAHHNLGNLLQERGLTRDALACFQRALTLRPNWAEGHNRVGATLHALGRLDEALPCFERALALNPHNPDIHWDYALALLAAGRYAEGWREYEWRWQRRQPAPRALAQPLWQGESLAGQRILVYCEQGYGDAIQFLRFLPRLQTLGAQVILEVHEPLRALAQCVHGADAVLALGEPLPPFDTHVSLLSLPQRLGLTAAELEPDTPYLTPPAERAGYWFERLALAGADDAALKVGIVWAGNPNVKNDRWRSPRLAPLLPLLATPGVRFFALQKGDGSRDIEAAGGVPGLVDFGPLLRDFADTAAVIAQLDLVITTDTSVAHLAGALGRPAWVMLHAQPDWRWGAHGERSPWYGSLKLYRQSQLGDWTPVIRALQADLHAQAAARGTARDAAATASPAGLRLDLACGQRKGEGFFGVDVAPCPGVDLVFDLTTTPWPWPDASVAEVRCNHFFEHLTGPQRIAFMEELWRVLVPQGRATITTPYWSSMRAIQDPTHQWPPVCEASYAYFNKPWRQSNKLDHYGIHCDFDFTHAYAIDPEWAGKDVAVQWYAARHYLNTVSDIVVTLTKQLR